MSCPIWLFAFLFPIHGLDLNVEKRSPPCCKKKTGSFVWGPLATVVTYLFKAKSSFLSSDWLSGCYPKVPINITIAQYPGIESAFCCSFYCCPWTVPIPHEQSLHNTSIQQFSPQGSSFKHSFFHEEKNEWMILGGSFDNFVSLVPLFLARSRRP